MFETMAQFVMSDHMYGQTFDPPLADAGYVRLLSKDRRPLRTQDGYVCVLIYIDRHWKSFCEMLGRRDMLEDPRFLATFDALQKHLCDGPYMRRYEAPDDFGRPETAFNICTFWRIDALARIGRMDEAREIFEQMLASRNPLGLLSEDTHESTGEMWGNFPQTYSMVGLINAAVRLSPRWDTVI